MKKRIFYALSRRGYLNLLSDKIYLKWMYWATFNKKLNLKNPKTFNEKLQWLKLFDRKDEYTKMSDKYLVRDYIKETIGEEYLIPCLGVYENFDEIPFDSLPNQFVIKCNHDSGGVIICKDKNTFDFELAKRKINMCLKKNYYYGGREWPYKNIQPRIIIEKYMCENNESMIDYKFFCMNGEPRFLYVSQGLENHATAQISFLTMDYKLAPFKRKDYRGFDEIPKKPFMYEKMQELAMILSKNIPFVRVDFYEINKKIYFGELTFYPCSGCIPFDPEEYDEILGKELIIKK